MPRKKKRPVGAKGTAGVQNVAAQKRSNGSAYEAVFKDPDLLLDLCECEALAKAKDADAACASEIQWVLKTIRLIRNLRALGASDRAQCFFNLLGCQMIWVGLFPFWWRDDGKPVAVEEYLVEKRDRTKKATKAKENMKRFRQAFIEGIDRDLGVRVKGETKDDRADLILTTMKNRILGKNRDERKAYQREHPYLNLNKLPAKKTIRQYVK